MIRERAQPGARQGALRPAGPPPRVFIIDDHADFRRLLGHHMSSRWPAAILQYYDPLVSGRLPAGFSGGGSDVVLLGHPAAQADALDWLTQLRKRPDFPPIVFLGNGDERQIVAAIRAGAADYVSKSTLTHQRLVEAVERALIEGAAPGEPAFDQTGRYVRNAPVTVPGYEYIRTLSEGEIASVYLARDRRSDRLDVLKVLHRMPESGGDKHFDRFLQEYELIARVNHPNVVRIFDLGVADDHAYIAMEYCSRGSLKRCVTAGIASAQAYAWMRTIAGALGALHAVGIWHRDLKPTNIMFREDGTLVLIDFGLAKQTHLKMGITGRGAIFGTPYYMSPEQGEGNPVDRRSDIYSLGIVFYEMLTGRKPYDGDSAMGVIIQHRGSPLPRLPAPLAQYQPAIDRMLAKKPADRFQSVIELLAWQPDAPVRASAERQ